MRGGGISDCETLADTVPEAEAPDLDLDMPLTESCGVSWEGLGPGPSPSQVQDEKKREQDETWAMEDEDELSRLGDHVFRRLKGMAHKRRIERSAKQVMDDETYRTAVTVLRHGVKWGRWQNKKCQKLTRDVQHSVNVYHHKELRKLGWDTLGKKTKGGDSFWFRYSPPKKKTEEPAPVVTVSDSDNE